MDGLEAVGGDVGGRGSFTSRERFLTNEMTGIALPPALLGEKILSGFGKRSWMDTGEVEFLD